MGFYFEQLTTKEQNEIDSMIQQSYRVNLIDLSSQDIDKDREYWAKHYIKDQIIGVNQRPIQFVYHKNKKFVSHMEELIKSVLTEMELKYEFDKQFVGTKVEWYKYDFYLPDTGHIIEYDGEQHFEPCNCFEGYSLKQGLKNDNLKNVYCLENLIPILRLPFPFSQLRGNIRKEIERNIRYFVGMNRVPSDIIQFYELYSWDNNYSRIAKQLNERLKDREKMGCI